MPRAGEWSTTAEGTQEEVYTCSRSKTPLLGRVRGRGVGRMRTRALRGWSASGSGSEWPEATCSGYGRPGASGGGYRWLETSCVIYRQQERTMVVVLEARGRHGLPPLGACEWALPTAPVTSGVGKKKKKKEGTATRHHTLLLSPSWEHTCPAAATAKCSGQHPDA